MAVGINTQIINAAKKLAGKPLAAASKVIGGATIASVIYDSHVNGKEKSNITDEVNSANRLYNLNKNYYTINKESATIAAMKKGWYLGQMTNGTSHFINNVKGYIVGAGMTIFNNAPMLALSAIAVRIGKIGKIPVGKLAGAVLGLSWVKTFLVDVVGIANQKK